MKGDILPSDPLQLSFRPRARLISVLGEHLISDQAVGIIELVKNAYDADATEVDVELRGLTSAKTTTVIIRDNGFGMTRDDIESKWLSPAVEHKERDKRENRRTGLGRLPIGEKGVGRFAVQQIGRKLELITRATNAPEIVLPVEWDRFENGEMFLDSMTVTVQEREPAVFAGARTGTLLRIEGARSQWTRQLLEKVHRTLRRLQSPLKDKETRFRVTLRCPDFPEYENIDPSDILDRAHYEFQALVEDDGQCDFEYHCRHPALPNRGTSGSENLVPLSSKELQGTEPRCGPFWVNLYVWDRTKNYLAESGISARELTAQCGVSLFRDGLRVLPYGEPGDDWLLLDQERIQDPSGRIGNNQVIGLIQVLQERNLRLRDKTNREGLIENEAFLDLKAMTRAAIRLFISYWKKDRPREESTVTGRHGSLAAAKGVATALKRTASEEVQVDIPAGSVIRTDTTDGNDGPSVDVEGDQTTVTQKEAVEILIENLDGATASAKEKEQRAARLLTLAATGLAAERVVHEFGRQVSASLKALADIRRGGRDARNGRALEVLEACLATLRSEFRILAPYETIDRAERAREFSIWDAAELALTINGHLIRDDKIEARVEGREFRFRGRPAAIVQVLDNLVHNSCYWLATVPADRQRRLLITIDPKERRIVIADNGPGVHEAARSHLFEPFFTMRAGGTGLGLYISSEITRRLSGRIALVDRRDIPGLPDWATGAVFVVTLGHPSSTTD